jgi:hypothetical protein
LKAGSVSGRAPQREIGSAIFFDELGLDKLKR